MAQDTSNDVSWALYPRQLMSSIPFYSCPCCCGVGLCWVVSWCGGWLSVGGWSGGWSKFIVDLLCEQVTWLWTRDTRKQPVKTVKTVKPLTRTRWTPTHKTWDRSSTGTGTGWPAIPQGYLWYSLNQTDLDWTTVAVALPFLDGWTACNRTGGTGCNCFKIPLQNTFKTHLKTLKMIKIWKSLVIFYWRLRDTPRKYL